MNKLLERNPLTCLTVPLLLLGCLSRAAELHVPAGGEANFPTIQAAIDAASEGDVVIVHPGTYQETLLFRGGGSDIRVTSVDPEDPAVVASTILDGDGKGSVVTFRLEETRETVLTGFTIRNGSGTALGEDAIIGGGIYCLSSSPSIIANVIENNSLPSDETEPQGLGAGILMIGGSSPLITRNVIRNNHALAGAGVFLSRGNPVISDNLILSNSATAGGAMFLNGQARVWNNTMVGNSADTGGHLLVSDSRPEIFNNQMVKAIGGPALFLNLAPVSNPSWISHNNFWNNEGGNFEDDNGPVELLGRHGNISHAPLWIDEAQANYRLKPGSPCINAGFAGALRSEPDLDFDGAARRHSARVDIGAHEFSGNINFPPIAEAGPDLRLSAVESRVELDGSTSFDPEAADLSFQWRQLSGAPVELVGSTSQTPYFERPSPGDYVFELIVSDGDHFSLGDPVKVKVRNLPPIASAGIGRSYDRLPSGILLDGSHSVDPEGATLAFDWVQSEGPAVELDRSNPAKPTFTPTVDGTYRFDLTVSDGLISSESDSVTYHIGEVRPSANAGQTHYISSSSVRLDGTASSSPHPERSLQYQWREIDLPVGGSELTIHGADSATPTIRGFSQSTTEIKEATFELTVSDNGLESTPSTVKVLVVPSLGNTTLRQENGSFDPDKPTIVSFGGGNCDTGSALSLGRSWTSHANLLTINYKRDLTSPQEAPTYYGYGDQLVVLLSRLAPDYDQPIQTIGHSTGNMPAFDVALRINTTFKDHRYAINRITMLDSGCNNSRNYRPNIATLMQNIIDGEQFWIDNYYSESGRYREGVFNVEFPVPPANHNDPRSWYPRSWSFPRDGGIPTSSLIAGGYLSVAGPGRHHQMAPEEADYYIGWSPDTSTGFPIDELTHTSPFTTTATLPGTVNLIGPDDGAMVRGGELFSCQPVENSVRYQLVVGQRPDRVDKVILETSLPPNVPPGAIPFPDGYWSIRAIDRHGSYSYGPPRLIRRDSDGDTLSDSEEVSLHRSNPNLEDTDQDGSRDDEELAVGTSLLLPDGPSANRIEVRSNQQLTIHSLGQPGKTYSIDFAADLSLQNWQSVSLVRVPISGDGSTTPIALSQDLERPGSDRGFFRLRLIESP